MTHRLYYTDPALQSFDAVVASVERAGNRLAVTLDRTAFYPSSGGQPFDTGTIGGLPVVDVVEQDDGSVVHFLAPPDDVGGPNPVQPGQVVDGVVDWPRRFDHMQQHTGQHVLSAAFGRQFGVRTVSFHLGSEVSTIDLARELTPAELVAGETEANRIVWEDRAVSIRIATAEEAAQLPLRKESVREGTLRLIDVDGFDLSACGGTHVARAGGIGVIAVTSWERFKGGQRIEFLCGARALGRFRALRDSMGAAARLLSLLPEDLPAAVERLQAESREQQRALAALRLELAGFRADQLAASAELTSAGRLVLGSCDADANGLKTLASAIVARPAHLVVLLSTTRPALAVVARSSDVSASAQHVVASLTARFGGRGGGKPELAQCGGLDGTAEAILDAARAALAAGS
jgi:alanyl-tRNA synthetase